MRRLLLLSALLAVLVPPSAPGARPDVTRVKGKATFPVTQARQHCAFEQGGGVRREACTPEFGDFVGTPSRAGASIGWARRLEMVGGAPTGRGTEKGILKLNFGGGMTLEVGFAGKIRPVGRQGRARGKTRSSGRCEIARKTGFARAPAAVPERCAYSLVIARRGSTFTSIVFSIVAAV